MPNDNIRMHTCKECQFVLPWTEFPKDKKMKLGHLNSCKKCTCVKSRATRTPESQEKARVYANKKYYENQDKSKQKQRNYYARNKEKRVESARVYREHNREKVLLRNRARYQQNREREIAKSLEYQRKNKESVRIRNAKWYKDNKEYVAKRAVEKYHNNPQSKLRTLMSRRVLDALALTKTRKSSKTLELLGCSIEFLRNYLESLFLPDMTWQNHGRYTIGGPMTWHIDHIKPCASFDLTDPEQQKQCFHYTNLQPLWAIDNLSKGDNLTTINNVR